MMRGYIAAKHLRPGDVLADHGLLVEVSVSHPTRRHPDSTYRWVLTRTAGGKVVQFGYNDPAAISVADLHDALQHEREDD